MGNLGVSVGLGCGCGCVGWGWGFSMEITGQWLVLQDNLLIRYDIDPHMLAESFSIEAHNHSGYFTKREGDQVVGSLFPRV